MIKLSRRLLILALALTTLFSVPLHVAGQTATPPPAKPTAEVDVETRIDAIFEQLSVEERVGQLFMVNFVGQHATAADAIGQLILEYKIGGVVLLEGNNNIANEAEDTPAQVVALTNALQQRSYEATYHGQEDTGFFLPLFVAVDHEGDGTPRTHLRSGFTEIPSAMAMGATWSSEDVEAVGTIVGQELAAVGINMLLGPVVDVLEKPHPEGSGDINIRAFGGSPFWVGRLGRAYIRGVHRGGLGRVLAIAKHFPGHGASDRSPDDEVATVNKSLAELQQSDLVPFFAVTRSDRGDPLGRADGMMPSHIRYRGFQGDVSQLTRPISLDPEGMAAFMALPPLDEWRQDGLIVCDSLGVPAIKTYYDPTLESFPAKQIAKDALMAGNDVLPLLSFSAARDPNWFSGQLPTIEATITYFREEYETSQIFRERVDEAVHHILRAKLSLYPDLALEKVLVSGQEPTGQGGQVVAEVARKALTLLYPKPEDLARRLPAPPRAGEEILIIGCFEECLGLVRLRANTVQETLLNLYGPDGSDLIDPQQVHTLDFMQLYQLMSGQLDEGQDPSQEEAQVLVERIQAADWIILVMINYMPDTHPESGAARLFLRDPVAKVGGSTVRFDLRDKKIVALALHAPYYLDATEIGKLTAYYAVYSKIQPSLEVALRALFQETTPSGASPVSVEGIGYSLDTTLLPDPDQELAVRLKTDTEKVWHIQDQIPVRLGPILDHNRHPIPDGTRVLFQGTYSDLPISLSPTVVTNTIDGMAGAVFLPVEAGRLEISASADGVQAGPVSLLVAPLAPTGIPAPTVSITATPRPTEPAPTPTPTSPTPTNTTAPPVATATTPAPSPSATSAVLALPIDEEGTPSGSIPLTPVFLGLGALLVLGSGGVLWIRRRGRVRGAPGEEKAGGIDETATVSAEIGQIAPSLTGRTLGSCRVERKLGEGGMGQVYQGYHPLLERSVAIKILPPALVESEEMRSRFLQEARIAAALRHPNIVQIYDFGEADGLMYMTMEYVDGTNLKNRLLELRAAEERMPLPEAVRIARQIAAALAYAHERGAIHRDLKPANILLNTEGQAILVDFGLAVLRGGPRHTEPGKVWGSPSYIAPEQLGETPQVDARSDVYSLGVILYELVVGRKPFAADNVMEVLWQQANVPPRPPSALSPDLPLALEAIILKALAKRPSERYTQAQDLADALEALQL